MKSLGFGLGKGTAAIGMGVALLAGSEASPAWLPAEGAVTVGICAPDSEALLQPTDCLRLPQLPQTTEYVNSDEATHRPLGTIAIRDGQPNFSASHLSGNHRSALRAACADPYVRYTLVKDPSPITLETSNSNEGATYSSVGQSGDKSVVTFWFTTSGAQANAQSTYGGYRATMVHEETHNLFGNWEKGTDPTSRALLHELDQTYHAELSYQAERLRTEKGAQITEQLNLYRAELDPTRHASTIASIDHMVQQLATPGGGQKLAITKTETGSALLDFDSLGRLQWHGTSIKPPLKGDIFIPTPTTSDIDVSPTGQAAYRTAEKIYTNFFSEAYGDINESGLLEGLVANDQGHGQAAATETTASLVTDARINPHKLAQTIRAMEPGRRERYLNQIKIIGLLFQKNDPAALPYLHLEQVIAGIEAS